VFECKPKGAARGDDDYRALSGVKEISDACAARRDYISLLVAAVFECYFVGDRGKLKISGLRGVVLFGKKHRAIGGEGKWTMAERCIQSPYFRTNPWRVRFADLVRATFTLQQRYRISCRRCNRRCNLYLVPPPSAYGLSYVRVMYVGARARVR